LLGAGKTDDENSVVDKASAEQKSQEEDHHGEDEQLVDGTHTKIASCIFMTDYNGSTNGI